MEALSLDYLHCSQAAGTVISQQLMNRSPIVILLCCGPSASCHLLPGQNAGRLFLVWSSRGDSLFSVTLLFGPGYVIRHRV